VKVGDWRAEVEGGEWERRFAALAERKTRQAAAARLSPLETLVDEPPPGFEPLGNPWTRRLFGGDFYLAPERFTVPAVSLASVQSPDDNRAADPPALGGETSWHLVHEGLARVAADAVLAGAGTIRGRDVVFSIWRSELVDLRDVMRLPRHPVQIVATLEGLSFDQTLLLNVPELPVVLLTVRACAARMEPELARRPWIRTVEMDDPAGLRPAFERLRAMGLTRIACVGGRTIARALLAAGVVQDLYLTTSAQSGGHAGTPPPPRPPAGRIVVRKRGTGPDAGVVFEHVALGLM
jgi:riboflavin biosynthesis pyrimidine reductase